MAKPNFLSFDLGRRLSLLLLGFLLFTQGQAQVTPEWILITADQSDVSVETPKEMIVHDDLYRNRIFFGYDGFSGKFERDKRNGRDYISGMGPGNGNPSTFESIKINGFTVLRNFHNDESGYWERVYIASKNRLYTFAVDGKSVHDVRLRRVLDSIKVKGKPIFQNGQVSSASGLASIDITSLESSQEVTDALKRPDAPSSVIRIEKIDYANRPKTTGRRLSRQVVVLQTAHAGYTDAALSRGINGSVNCLILFRADGTIGQITADSRLDLGLAQNAADASRRIKFLPAQIDGKPVDSILPIKFGFQ